MQLLSLIPILILLSYLLVSKDLVYTGSCELGYGTCTKREQCLLRFIQVVLVLKLQVVSALQMIVSVRVGI